MDKAVIADSGKPHVPPARAKTIEYTRSKTLRSFLRRRFTDKTLFDIFTHGAHLGWPNLTTTKDCRYLYKRYSTEIWTIIISDHSIRERFLLSVGQLKESNDMECFVVWRAAEAIAREFAGDWVERSFH